MTEEPSLDQVTEFNRAAWDGKVQSSNQWTVPVSAEEIARARNGEPHIVLTPIKPVPLEWMAPLADKDVLLLAGGGGQQAPLIAAAGARVTTLDNSSLQLKQDEQVARREGLEIRTVLGKMQDLSMFDDASYDLIVHPCSNCFTPNVREVWSEAYRVLRVGGSLLSGFNDPLRYIFDYDEYENGNLVARHKIPYSDLEDMSPETRKQLIDEGEALEFGHSLNDQIGGQIDAGFVLAGFYTDNFGDQKDAISPLIDTFMATRAMKMADPS